jgi:hypothetical protein
MRAVLRMLGVVIGCCVSAAASDEFPYTAYVAVDGAEVVAGPGHRYYATGNLLRGTELEIYREEASGWLAIRPPEGSFSWIPAEHVERSPEDEDVGRVREPAAAWIGTAVEQVSQHRQQVTLRAGELVQILGEKTVVDADGQEETWLKIAPPAGEFRWIHLRDVSRQKPEETATQDYQQSSALTPALSQREREPEEQEPRRLEVGGSPISIRPIEVEVSQRDRRVELTQFHNSPSGKVTQPASSDGFVARTRRAGEPAPTAPQSLRTSTPPLAHSRKGASTRAAAAAPAAPAAPAAVGGAPAGDIDRELDQIEVDLSLTLAQDKSLWNLAPLRQRTQQLVEQGAGPIARGRARLLLDKIQQFEDAFDVREYGPISTPAAAQAAALPAAGSLSDPRYDATGWLKPVVSRKNEKPVADYAVVDQDGQPLCFVSPSPGLNLHRYLNKQVGLYGRRGYLPELKKPHVIAERVIDLDRQWRYSG